MRSGDQLRLDIGRLLESARGEEFLKRLFWEVLGFGPANDPVPVGLVPARMAGDVHDARIMGRWENLVLVHVRFAASMPLAQDEQPIIERVCRQWPDTIVLFSNFRGTQWDVCRAMEDGRLARFALDRELHSVDEMANALSQMRTFDLKSGDDIAGLEVSAGSDRAMTSPRRRLDRRIQQRENASILFRMIPFYPMRSGEEQIALGTKWKIHGDADAREWLICSNIRLALHFTKKACRRICDFDDFSQEACLGLMRAVSKYEPERGYRFTTYATWWVRQHIARGRYQNSALIQVPWYLIDGLRDKERGKEPKYQDGTPIAAELLKAADRALSVGVDAGRISANTVDEQEQRRSFRAELSEHLSWAVNQLEQRLRRIIELRFGLNDCIPMTLEELGKEYKITRERIRQLETEALRQLRVLFSKNTKWDWNDPKKRPGATLKFKLTADSQSLESHKPRSRDRSKRQRRDSGNNDPTLWEDEGALAQTGVQNVFA